MTIAKKKQITKIFDVGLQKVHCPAKVRTLNPLNYKSSAIE